MKITHRSCVNACCKITATTIFLCASVNRGAVYAITRVACLARARNVEASLQTIGMLMTAPIVFAAEIRSWTDTTQLH